MFARNTLCVVTTSDRPFDTGNLVETLLKPEIRIGTSTPGADPSGDYTWEMFRRVDALKPGAYDILSKKAQQLFGGPNTSAPINGRPRVLVALDENQIDLFISYCSGAQQIVRELSKYKSIALSADLAVGPEYGLTVSREAQAGAAGFALYLLSPQGQKTLQSFGFIPVALPVAQ
jgi:ABC-type molybdate transport system substrate-binding protein